VQLQRPSLFTYNKVRTALLESADAVAADSLTLGPVISASVTKPLKLRCCSCQSADPQHRSAHASAQGVLVLAQNTRSPCARAASHSVYLSRCHAQALQMVSAIQVRGQHHHQQQQPMPGRRSRGSAAAAGAAAGLIDTSAHQQVAALGALVALLLQLQVRHAFTKMTSYPPFVSASERCADPIK
jgi:hypothetical protein